MQQNAQVLVELSQNYVLRLACSIGFVFGKTDEQRQKEALDSLCPETQLSTGYWKGQCESLQSALKEMSQEHRNLLSRHWFHSMSIVSALNVLSMRIQPMMRW